MRFLRSLTRIFLAALVATVGLVGAADAQTWTNLNPTGPVVGDYFSKGVYDPATNSMLLFGGERTYNAQTNEVTALNLTGAPQWTTVATSGPKPAPRNLPVVA
jgi:hypothetical protein